MFFTYVARTLSSYIKGSRAAALTSLKEVDTITMRAWPWDVDAYGHINNGRYLTMMDSARFHVSVRTGIVRTCARKGWIPLVATAQCSYLREVGFMKQFDIETRLIHLDRKWLFMEHRVVSDEGLHAVAYVKGVFKHGRRTVSPDELFSHCLIEDLHSKDELLPNASVEARAWVEQQLQLEESARAARDGADRQ